MRLVFCGIDRKDGMGYNISEQTFENDIPKNLILAGIPDICYDRITPAVRH